MEDNPGDAYLFEQGCGDHRDEVSIVQDGEQALTVLYQAKGKALPDLVILDLNLPKVSGHEVLAELKKDERLRSIPVIVMSSSRSPDEIRRIYDLQASCYIEKPNDLDQFLHVCDSIYSFWLQRASLPPKN